MVYSSDRPFLKKNLDQRRAGKGTIESEQAVRSPSLQGKAKESGDL